MAYRLFFLECRAMAIVLAAMLAISFLSAGPIL